VFSRSYYDPEVHQLAECGSNVWHLLSRLDRAGVDLSGAHVLYLFRMKEHEALLAPDNLRRLHPSFARFGLGSLSVPWLFHVCLEYQGRILDLDYGHSPQAVSTRDYFASMFSSELSDLSFRSIPAVDYLREYDAQDPSRNWQYYLSGGGRRFPISEVLDWLRSPTPP
jgi:hypothetical protein